MNPDVRYDSLEDEVAALHEYIHAVEDAYDQPVYAISLPADWHCIKFGVTSICAAVILVDPESELNHIFDGL